MIDARAATDADDGAVFTLQRAAFVDEAVIYGTPFVPALEESFARFGARMRSSTSWVAETRGRIVGAVSLRNYRPGGPDVERLMVAPDCRGRGISRRLLDELERHAAVAGHERLQLIVGDLAVDNRAIYEHLGWGVEFSHRLDGAQHVLLHTMTKRVDRTARTPHEIAGGPQPDHGEESSAPRPAR